MGKRPRRPRETAVPPPAEPRARRRPPARLTGAIAAILAAAAAAAAWRHAQPRVHRQAGLNVLLVTIDTLRADALGCYGNTAATTPSIDRLAAGGARFADVHGHNVITLPSHANILSGRYPTAHGIHDNAGFRFPDTMDTLATILQAHGYRTGAFVSAFPLDSRFGLARGFDVYDDRFGDRGSHHAFVMEERRGVDTVAAARAWLQAQGSAPTFCWVHVYEPHFPYVPPEPWASRYRGDPYHGEVATADAALEPLLAPLLQAGDQGRTLVVLTADHGESLGEHGEQTHGIFAYEGTLRVPLILYAPALFAPRVVEEAAFHMDILPTVLDALSMTPPAGLPGRSLLPAASGARLPPVVSYFESISASINRGWAPLRGVIDRRQKFIELPMPELYDLAHDLHEEKNLAASRPEILDRLRAELARQRIDERAPQRAAEDRETRERLKALGYVTAAAPADKKVYTDADDPKRLIDLDAAIQEVVGLYTSGDLAGALTRSRQLVARRPDMPLALIHLAFLEREAGDLGAAVAAARRALALNPEDTDVVALLGAYLNESGRSDEAARLLEPYATRKDADLDALIARGIALAQLGRREEALATFDRVRQIDPSNAMALVNIGTVHLMAGDLDRARAAFHSALALDPGLARAHNSLGVIAARAGREEEAVAEWRRAVELDPGDHQTLFNLGMLLLRRGRPEEARPFLEAYVRAAPRALEARDIARVQAWLEGRSKTLDRPRSGAPSP